MSLRRIAADGLSCREAATLLHAIQ